MNEGKVVIPRKVAEAIENMRKRWEDKALVQFENYESPTIDSYPELRIIKNYFGLPHSSDNFTELMRALVNGYEVERTPHEKLREYYEDMKRAEDRLEMRGDSGSQFRQGWITVLDTLEILGELYPELAELRAELKGDDGE